MRIETTHDDQLIRHLIVGELDADNCHRLVELLPVLADGSAVIDLDLAQVTFIDSSALSALLKLKSSVEQTGGSMLVSSISPQVERVLDITGLLPTFDIGPSS